MLYCIVAGGTGPVPVHTEDLSFFLEGFDSPWVQTPAIRKFLCSKIPILPLDSISLTSYAVNDKSSCALGELTPKRSPHKGLLLLCAITESAYNENGNELNPATSSGVSG